MAGAPGPRGPIKFLSEEEKKNAPKVTKELMLRILSYLRPYWLQLLLVLAAIVLSATLGLLPSIITGRVVDGRSCCRRRLGCCRRSSRAAWWTRLWWGRT